MAVIWLECTQILWSHCLYSLFSSQDQPTTICSRAAPKFIRTLLGSSRESEMETLTSLPIQLKLSGERMFSKTRILKDRPKPLLKLQEFRPKILKQPTTTITKKQPRPVWPQGFLWDLVPQWELTETVFAMKKMSAWNVLTDITWKTTSAWPFLLNASPTMSTQEFVTPATLDLSWTEVFVRQTGHLSSLTRKNVSLACLDTRLSTISVYMSLSSATTSVPKTSFASSGREPAVCNACQGPTFHQEMCVSWSILFVGISTIRGRSAEPVCQDTVWGEIGASPSNDHYCYYYQYLQI